MDAFLSFFPKGLFFGKNHNPHNNKHHPPNSRHHPNHHHNKSDRKHPLLHNQNISVTDATNSHRHDLSGSVQASVPVLSPQVVPPPRQRRRSSVGIGTDQRSIAVSSTTAATIVLTGRNADTNSNANVNTLYQTTNPAVVLRGEAVAVDAIVVAVPEEEYYDASNSSAVTSTSTETTTETRMMIVMMETDSLDENDRKRGRSSSSSSSDIAAVVAAAGRDHQLQQQQHPSHWSRSSVSGSRTPGLLVTSPWKFLLGTSPEHGNNDVLTTNSRFDDFDGNHDIDSDNDDIFNCDDDLFESRPVKRFRGTRNVIPIFTRVPASRSKTTTSTETISLSQLPEDALAHCLSFLGGVQNRFALQATSPLFRKLSNTDSMLKSIRVGGDQQTGLHGIIREYDSPASAARILEPYVNAGNLEATYMQGIIQSYCNQDVDAGIQLLQRAAAQGYIRASYTLGLALRDARPEESVAYMVDAASHGYIPALHELLSPRKMKEKYGEPPAHELRLHLDPLCLNRLLSRYYVQTAELRDVSTSHCWNPLCGRWAFKADSRHSRSHSMNTTSADNSSSPTRHHSQSILSTNAAMATAVCPIVSSLVSPGVTCSVAAATTSVFPTPDVRVSRMKVCSRCCRAKYCSKLCQVYDWRSGRHKMECQFL